METTTRKYLTCIRNFLLISLPFLGHSTTLFSQTCEQDRAALIALYEATNEAPWTDTTNWLTDKPLEEWYGVTQVNAQGCVERLQLQNNNLTGDLTNFLLALPNLKHLNLDSNKLSGNLPDLSLLQDLDHLSLGSSGFTGSIPKLSLPNLKYLSLSTNDLSGNIPNLSLPKLTYLDLNKNNLEGSIPPDLFQGLANLVTFNAVGNKLTGPIPPEFSKLTNLQYLDLSENALGNSIPKELGKLSALIKLNLSNNNPKITGIIPPELGDLSNLDALDLSLNDLKDSIPSSLGKLCNLIFLSLHENDLTGAIPSQLGNLKNLEFLRFENNNLTGAIPPTLGNLGNLVWLQLFGNELSGTIPPELGNLSNLVRLHLDGNSLSGSIPSELGNLVRLEDFYLYDNDLSGCIPDALKVYCSSTTKVDITGNPKLPWQGDFEAFCNGEIIQVDTLEKPFCKPTVHKENIIQADTTTRDTTFNEFGCVTSIDIINWMRSSPDIIQIDTLEKTFCETTVHKENIIQTDTTTRDTTFNELGCATDIDIINWMRSGPDIIQIDTLEKPFCEAILHKENIIQADTTTRDTMFNDFGCATSVDIINWKLIPPPSIPSKTISFDPTNPTDIILFDLADCPDCIATNLSSNCNINGNILTCTPDEVTCDSLKITFNVCKNECLSACATATITVFKDPCEIIPDCSTLPLASTPLTEMVCDPTLANTTTRDTFQNMAGCDSITITNKVLIPPPTIPSQTIALNASNIALFNLADCLDCSVTSLSTNSSNCDINDVNENVLNCMPNQDNCDSLKVNFVVCKNICSSACDTATLIVYREDCEIVPDCTNEEIVITSDSTFCEPFEYLGVLIQSDTTTRDTLENVAGCDSIMEITWVFIPPPTIPSQIINFDPTNPTPIELTDCSDCRVTTVSSDDIDETTMNLNGNVLNFPPMANTCDSLKIVFEACQMDCPATCTTATITLYNQDACQLSSILTPNGDGIEDNFIIPEIYDNQALYPNYELSIFNRWGGQVYYTDRYEGEGWDGRSNRSGQHLPDGAYFYLLRLNTTNEEPVKGVISLIR